MGDHACVMMPWDWLAAWRSGRVLYGCSSIWFTAGMTSVSFMSASSRIGLKLLTPIDRTVLQEDIFTGDAGAAKALPDLAFVAVSRGRISVEVPNFDGGLYGGDGLFGRGLVDAEPDRGHGDAVIQGDEFNHSGFLLRIGRCCQSWPARIAAMTPPSMRRSEPVMKAPSGPRRYPAMAATSAGVPMRPAAEVRIMFR